MPKGVEHRSILPANFSRSECRYLRCRKALSTNARWPSIGGRSVQIPQMPKGVEHAATPRRVQAGFGVQIPQMPKGVEHQKMLADLTKTESADTSDAERR